MPHLAETERLGNGERPVPKLRLRREDLDTDATFPQIPQGQRGLEGRDTPAGDQYPRRHLNHLLRAASATITPHLKLTPHARAEIADLPARKAERCGPQPRIRSLLPGRKHVLGVFGSGTGIVWSVDPAAWAAKACSIAHRNLTPGEWTEFLGHREYHHLCP